MAENRHDGGGTGPFPFTFTSIKIEHIKVSVNNQDQASSAYTINNYNSTSGGTVTFSSATASGTNNVRIYRQTDGTTLEHTFQVGSSIKASDLNESNKQGLFLAEENRESINSLAAGDATGAIQISGSNIADNSITTSKILDLEVGTNDLANLAVTTGKIADDAVTTDKLANSINTTIAGKANTGANLSTFTNDTNYITLAQVPASFVTGMIMMFTGSTAPSGWAFCDGNNGTPDLRNRFIVGAGSTYNVGDTGGANQVTLTENQMPQHNHTFSGSGSDTHNHSYPTGQGGSDADQGPRAPIRSRDEGLNGTYTTNNATVNISISGTTNNSGSGGSHENRPPYYALAFIMKT